MPIDNDSFPLIYAYASKYFRFFEGIDAAGASLGAGVPPVGEVSVAAAEYMALPVDTGDEAYCLFDPQGDLGQFDLGKDIAAQIVFESANAAPTGIILAIAMKGVAEGVAVSDAKVTPDGSVTFATQNGGGAGLVKATNWAALGVAGELHTETPALSGNFVPDQLIQVAVTLTDRGASAADQIRLIALRLRGTRRLFNSRGLKEVT